MARKRSIDGRNLFTWMAAAGFGLFALLLLDAAFGDPLHWF